MKILRKTCFWVLVNFIISSFSSHAYFFRINNFYQKKLLAYGYFIDVNIKKNSKGWKTFNDSAFLYPKLLNKAAKDNIPVLLIIPDNYKTISTIGSLAPWIEGSRVALAWSAVFNKFKKLGSASVNVVLYEPNKLNKIDLHRIASNLDDLSLKKFEDFNLYKNLQEKHNRARKNKVTRVQPNSFDKDLGFRLSNININPNLPELNKSQERIVITGGAGFLGSAIAKNLLSMGHQVIVLDNLSCCSGKNIEKLKNNKNFYFAKFDVSKPFNISGNISSIMHLASVPSPAFYYTKPIETLTSGLNGTKNCLDLAVKKNAKFFFASTSEVYGDPKVSPQPESYTGNVNPIGQRAQYDQSKRGAETLIKLYTQRYKKLDVRIARIFNSYGPHMAICDGRVITNFIKAVLENKPMEIHGDGNQTRSFAYVSDTVDGMLKILFTDKVKNLPLDQRIFNVGNSQEFTINQLANLLKVIAKKYNFSATCKHIDQIDKDDPRLRKPNLEYIYNMLGFETKVPLNIGLEKMFLHHLNKHNNKYN